ncbi:MAG: divergent polysaccharide deacetylase family protein [Rhodospirillales bacterium]
MALGGVFGGYYIGKEVAPAPKPAPPVAKSTSHHTHTTNSSVYEESLPRDIIIQTGGKLKRIALPEPDAEIDLGNGTPGTQKSANTEKAEQVAGKADEGTEPAVNPDEPKPITSETEATPQPSKSKDEPQTAALPVFHPARALPGNIAELQRLDSSKLPPWQRFARPVSLNGKPEIVIVMDDLGLDRSGARRTIALPGPLTLSFMSYAEDLAKQALEASKAGHELMLHVPMEPGSTAINPGPNVLLSGMPESELLKSIDWNLQQMTGYVGINNHMGSRFTADREGMGTVVRALRQRGYLFLDSVTSSKSVAHETARDGGIPYAVRNVFLDHDDDLERIRAQLRHTEQIARRTGLAIAIGHPRDKTIEALKEWLPTLPEKGFQLVPISAVVRIGKE